MPFPIASAKYPGGTGTAASPAYSGIFIPTIWSNKLIEKFYSTTVLAAISNTAYEGEIKKFGDHVIIRQKPTIAIRSYQADQELTVDRPSSNVLDLYIDQADYFNLVLDDVMRIQADLNMMDLWAEDASEQMKIKIDTKVLAVFPTGVAAANKGATAGALSGNINLGAAGTPLAIVGRKAGSGQTDPVDLLVAMGQCLDEQNVPETGRWAVVPAWFRSLLMGSDIRQAYLTGDDTSPLRNGRVGVIDRFTIYASNLLPTGVETGGNATWVFAGHQNGLTFASQMTELESMRSERAFGTIMRGLQVYGYAMTDPTCVVAAYGRKTAVVGSGT